MQDCCKYFQNPPTNTTTEASLSDAVDNITAGVSDLSINAFHYSVFSILKTTMKITQHLHKIEPSQIKEVEKAYCESLQHGDSHMARIFLLTLFYPIVKENYIMEATMAGMKDFFTGQLKHAVAMLYRLFQAAIEIYYKLEKWGKSAVSQNTQQPTTTICTTVSVSTFNILPDSGANRTYRTFLAPVFQKMNCDIYLLQECTWTRENLWEQMLTSNYIVRGFNTNSHAGMAVIKAGAVVRGNHPHIRVLKYINSERWRCYYLTTTTTQQQQEVQFLSFSYHAIRHPKVKDITDFISEVMCLCDEEQCQLPAIIGGDFNYDIKDIDNWPEDIKPHIQFCAGTPEPQRSIDFLCVVYGERFKTKMILPETLTTRLDIAEEARAARFDSDVTTHPALFGHILLYSQR